MYNFGGRSHGGKRAEGPWQKSLCSSAFLTGHGGRNTRIITTVGAYFIVRNPTERASTSTATCGDAFTLITFKIPSLVSGSVKMSKCPPSLPFNILNFTLRADVNGESPSWTSRHNTPWLARPSAI